MNDGGSSLFSDLAAAFAILGMLAAVTMSVLRLRAASQREIEQAREREALATAYAQLAAAKSAAEMRASQLAATLAGLSDGVMLVDAELRLVQWNARWTELAGVPPELLRVGVGIEDLLRAQAQLGEFGLVDVETEVARRMQRLRSLIDSEDIERERPNGRRVRIRRKVLPDGGQLSVATDVTMLRPPPQKTEARQPALPRRTTRLCVLLVEDIVVNQVVTATQLRRDGHRVDIAASGREAVRMVAHTPYDIVLMDLMMPEMSGIEATEAIRRLPGFVARVPILALTATARQEDRARCMQAGMQGMLSKPIRPDALSEAIATVLAPGAPRPQPQPPAPPPSPEILLDAARLEDLRQGLPPGLFEELAQQCIVDMRERMMDLHEAVDTSALTQIGTAAHALAGMAGSYGMAAVERRMRRLMAASQAADTAACRAAAEGMDDELQRTEAQLRGAVSASPG